MNVFVSVIVSVVELTVVGFEAELVIFVIDVTVRGVFSTRSRGVVNFVIFVDGVESEDVEKIAGVAEDVVPLVVITLNVLDKEEDDRGVDEENVGVENEE